jgi:class 3 adenylate cyclase/tetratricopeptide (TPR) repeat protein
MAEPDAHPAPALLRGDNPQAYVPGDRRRALARGETLPTTCTGAVLFVDISGFTPLTEALARELGGRRGAEELTATLDRVFAALLHRLHAWDGSVVYFSGDAVTAWMDGDDGLRAVACALEMQRVMDDVGRLTTPGGTQVTLAVKVAVAVGQARRFVVGDPDVQLVDVLAGSLMDSMADAEQHARPGEVVLDASAVASLGRRVRLRGSRDGVGVVAGLVVRPDVPGEPEPYPDLPLDVARQWLLPPVWERIAAGRGELLAELRPAVPLFVQLGGLDFDHDPRSPEVLDAVVTTAQRCLAEVGGHVLQLTIGDKGVNLYAVLGSPIAHEDDATRACLGALALRRALGELPVTDVRIGIATGQLRSGTYGHDERRTFCCLGDAVNLAARLMSRAPSDGILVHGEVAAAARGFEWEELDPITVKGKARPVAVRALRGEATTFPRQRPEHERLDALVGRDDELTALRLLWQRSARGDGQVVLVRADAGGGKSRLAAELVDGLVADGVSVAWTEATSATGSASYVPWRPVWWTVLGLEPGSATAEDVEAAVAALDESLVPRAPLLGPVLGLPFEDNSLTAGFDGETRKNSAEDLLTRLLRARAIRGPLAVVIDDAHWLGGLSGDLLTAVCRAVRDTGTLLLVTARPEDTTGAALPPLRGSHVTTLEMGSLDPDSAVLLVRERFAALGAPEPSSTTVTTIVGRAEGNPFYLVQLVDYLLAHRDDDPDALELPLSLQTLVLSRIDGQPEGSRRAVKVASVVGRDFRTPLVASSYPDLGVEEQVHSDLLAMATTHLIEVEDESSRAFVFGHAVTREVAYDSLPHGIRTVLHGRVADVLEREPDGPVRHLDVLAFHYARSDVLPKRKHYLLTAADAARRAWANAAAVAYLELALPQVEADELPDVLLRLAEAQELAGDWAAAEATLDRCLHAALDVASTVHHARALAAQAELARKQGRYAEAEELLITAELEFVEAGERSGVGRVLHLRGTLASQQGDPQAARSSYEASLRVRRELGDEEGVAALLTNLALVAEDEGDLDEAERVGLDALGRRRGLGDTRAVSVSLMNMGMLATAREELDVAVERFAEALALAEEVGDPWLASVGRHNLGNAARDHGDLDAAQGHLLHALRAYADHNDRWSVAHALEDVAVWLVARDGDRDEDALVLMGAAEALREEIGAPRFPPTVAAIEMALVPARRRTPAERLDAAVADGRGLDQDAAVARAVVLLEG